MKNFVIIFILLIIVSCGKVFKTELKGRVLNPLTGLGIENAQVTFSKTTFGLPAGSKQLKSTYTDANGYFEIAYRNFKGVHVAVVLDASKYHFLGWKKDGKTYSYLSLKKGKNEADFHVVPFGELKFDILNVNCEGVNDLMNFRKKYEFENSYDSYSSNRIGCYSYLSNESSIVPCGEYEYEIKVIRSTGISSSNTKITVLPNQENIIKLHY